VLIFITGATGFIGSHLAERLASAGHQLRCLARSTSDLTVLQKLNASVIIADITDKDAIGEALKGVDIVYHSAALVGEWLSKDEARDINIRGTQNILEASLKANVKRFVHISSLAVLGMKHHHNTPVDAPYQFTGDIYSDTKIESEKMVMEFSGKTGLPAVAVRAGFVFGLRDRRFLPRVVNLLQKRKFFFLGAGNNIMNIVYIDNLVDVLIESGLNREAIGQVYNVTNKDKATMRDFVFMICDITGLEKPHKSIPVPLAKFVASSLEMCGRLAKKKDPPLLTKARVKVAALNLDFDISKTIKELGYDSKVSIREGLEKTLKS
jgi:nucleoside-diphosphate-sugar epimerase